MLMSWGLLETILWDLQTMLETNGLFGLLNKTMKYCWEKNNSPLAL